jgi:hypothetical protein
MERAPCSASGRLNLINGYGAGSSRIKRLSGLRCLLPPLCDNKGIAGVHLCLADESISKVETAEKKRARTRRKSRPGSC